MCAATGRLPQSTEPVRRGSRSTRERKTALQQVDYSERAVMTSHVELAERYKRLRHASFELNKVLLDFAPKQAIEHAGRKLGLWHKGTLVFGKEDEVNVLMDYVIYDCYEDGANAVDRYIRERPPAPGSDEQKVLRAEQQAFYTVVLVEEVLKGLGVRVHDLLMDRRFLLADIGFSQTAVEGLVLATRLIPFEDFVMTAGAALPLDADALAGVASNVIAGNLGDGVGAFADMTKERKADVTAAIIRLALEADASASIEYADVDEAGAYAPTAPVINASPKVGRNDPCPCGSGKKYKRCCGPWAAGGAKLPWTPQEDELQR